MIRPQRARLANAILCLSLVFVGQCAFLGSGPDIVHASGYQFHAPSSWKKMEPGESDHAYRLPSNDIATLTSSCHGHPDAPLEILTRHLLFGTHDAKIAEQRHISVNGIPALRTEVRETLDGKAFSLILVVLSKNGCVFDFDLLSPKTIGDREDQEFMRFTESFSFQNKSPER